MNILNVFMLYLFLMGKKTVEQVKNPQKYKVLKCQKLQLECPEGADLFGTWIIENAPKLWIKICKEDKNNWFQ